jgi:hypothetical protein
MSGKPAKSLPPVEKWNPPFCGDSGMHIDREGRWYHNGSPIARFELVKLFAGILRLDPDGYVLVTPVEKLTITVEDAPFLAVLVDRAGEDLIFTTNIGDIVTLDADHALLMKDGVPYLHIRRRLKARVARSVYYQLAEMAVEEGGQFGVRSAGRFFPLAGP